MIYSGTLELIPRQGLCRLRFGASRTDARKYFGEPESIEHIDDIEEYKSIVWHYWEKGFSLFFDDSRQNTFSCVELDDARTILWNQEVFKLGERQIIKLFKDHGFVALDTEEHEWGEKRVSFDDAMVDLYFEGEVLTSVNCCIPGEIENVLLLSN
jgi:hypothetical protein